MTTPSSMKRNENPDRFSYVCEMGGLTEAESLNPAKVKELDLVLDDLCTLQPVERFVGLERFIFIQQGITEINCLKNLSNLRELWLSENMITRISGLDCCLHLRKLHLSCNRLTKIEGLNALTELEVLWLSENQIISIDGLESLTRLKELNMSQNQITLIGTGLDSLEQLEVLDLAKNKIGNFKELLNLTRLPSLIKVTFFDPHYGQNPICNLCNYQTYLLYHLPRLQVLDTLQISESAKAFAEATFMKKRMYYNMRIKTIQRNTSNILKMLKTGKRLKLFKLHRHIDVLSKRLKELMREVEERQILPKMKERSSQENQHQVAKIYFTDANLEQNPLDSLDDSKFLEDMEGKWALIQGRIHSKNQDITDIVTIHDSIERKVVQLSEQNISRLITELETGGNIRFEEGRPGVDKWYQSCVDLVKSRFAPEQMEAFGIIGINVSRVTRIHNRFLRNRFEERLEQMVDLSDSPAAYKRSLEYLFYGVDPADPQEIFRAMEQGFRSPEQYKMTMLPNYVSLVNSVAASDLARINHFIKAEDGAAFLRRANKLQREMSIGMGDDIAEEMTLQNGLVEIPSGQILICKVFLSRCVQDQHFEHFNPNHAPSTVWKYAPLDSNNYKTIQSVYRTLESDSKSRMWFVFDNCLVLPEYLVEFDYITNFESTELVNMKDPEINKEFNELCDKVLTVKNYALSKIKGFPYKSKQLLTVVDCGHLSYVDLDRSDMGCMKKQIIRFLQECDIHSTVKILQNGGTPSKDIVTQLLSVESSIPPEIPSRTKIGALSIDNIRAVARMFDLSCIVYLNLHDNSLQRLEGLSSVSNLQTLILSFNHIQRIQGLSGCKLLKKIDLSYNEVKKVEGLKDLSNLQYLELNDNCLNEIEEVELLRLESPNLLELSLKGNRFSTKKLYRFTVATALPTLLKLDGVTISENDRDTTNACKLELSDKVLRQCAKVPVRSFTGALMNEMKSKTVEGQLEERKNQNVSDQNWQRYVQILNINHKSIARMTSSLSKFSGLRKLSLIDNKIEKIEGLSACRLLEELSLEKNKISKIEGLRNLQFLKKLDLGRNRISAIEGLEKLEHLSQLSIQDNRVTQLTGLADLPSLMELYLGNNQITRLKEVMNLKPLSKLIILDLSGNLMCKEKNYRIYCVFHLKKLKVLDGVSIEQDEQHKAKEMFAGRLTDQVLEARSGGKAPSHLRELNLSNSKLRDFDSMFDQHTFQSLVELNLNNNFMESLRGVAYLPKLKVLQISSNRLQTLFCQPCEDGYPKGLMGLPALEVLDISHNLLNDLYGIQYANLKHLKILNAASNDIQKVEHLESLKSLVEIDLSKNRVRQLDAQSFPLNNIITCVKMEDNGLRSLTGLERLVRVQSLFLNGNRVTDMMEIQKLADLTQLIELQIQSNPLVRKNLYRPQVIKKMPQLLYLDGKEISMEERERIEAAFVQEQRMMPMVHYAQIPSSKVPIKMNSINFDGVFSNMKIPQDQPPAHQHLTAMLSNQQITPPAQMQTKDMSNLILVSSYYPQSGSTAVSTDYPSQNYAQRHGSKSKRPASKTDQPPVGTTASSGVRTGVAAPQTGSRFPTSQRFTGKGQTPPFHPPTGQGSGVGSTAMIQPQQQSGFSGAPHKKNSAGSASGALIGYNPPKPKKYDYR